LPKGHLSGLAARQEIGMSKKEGSSLVWLGLAVLICIGSLRLSLGSFQNPGPGFLPFIAGLVLGILSVIVYLQARRSAATAPGTKQPLWTNPGGVKKIFLTSLALLAYGVGLNYLGFLISTFIFLAFLLRIVERRRWGLVILESLLASGISYFIFELALQAELPRGIFL
jgi:putative tricarboxylic transport membrane protein